MLTMRLLLLSAALLVGSPAPAGAQAYMFETGATLLAKPFLQVGLLLLQGAALLLQLLLLLAPAGVGGGQGLHRLLQSLFLLLQRLALVPQAFDRQLPFPLGLQQRIPFLAGSI